MLICVKCRKELRCEKNGVGAAWGNNIYAADRWECPSCGLQVLKANDNGYYDPERRACDEYLEMEREEN